MKKNLVRQQTTWSEEFSTGGRQLVTLIERLVEKGNARRLIIIKPSGRAGYGLFSEPVIQTPGDKGLPTLVFFKAVDFEAFSLLAFE